jgi:rare lipoprotein A
MSKASSVSLLVLIACLSLQACSSSQKRSSSTRSQPPVVGEGPGTPSTVPNQAGSSGSSRPAIPSQAPAPSKRAGGYYLDDGPGLNPPDIDAIPDASPKLEPLATRANRPYSIFGIQYLPLTQLKPYRERGFASWYGKKFHGQTTSNGERYDMYAMTAAHPTFPLPSYAKVTNPKNGKSVIVRVNDRGPFLNNRIIDLSYTAAAKLGYVNSGSTEVEVSLIDEPEKFAVLAKAPSTISTSASTTSTTATTTSATVASSSATSRPASVVSDNPSAPANTRAEPIPLGAAATTQSPGEAANLPPASAPEPGLVLTRETLIAQQSTAPVPGLYLQLGAFGAKETADATKQRLAQQFPWLSADPQSKIDYLLRPEAGLFKLHIGPFKTRADALANIERLRSESGLQAFVVAR